MGRRWGTDCKPWTAGRGRWGDVPSHQPPRARTRTATLWCTRHGRTSAAGASAAVALRRGPPHSAACGVRPRMSAVASGEVSWLSRMGAPVGWMDGIGRWFARGALRAADWLSSHACSEHGVGEHFSKRPSALALRRDSPIFSCPDLLKRGACPRAKSIRARVAHPAFGAGGTAGARPLLAALPFPPHHLVCTDLPGARPHQCSRPLLFPLASPWTSALTVWRFRHPWRPARHGGRPPPRGGGWPPRADALTAAPSSPVAAGL